MTSPVYLDENEAHEVARQLRREGYDIETAAEAGLASAGVPDDVQLRHACETGRVLMTQDLKTMSGTIQAWLDAGNAHPGVFLCDERPPHELIARLPLALQQYEPEDLRNTTR